MFKVLIAEDEMLVRVGLIGPELREKLLKLPEEWNVGESNKRELADKIRIFLQTEEFASKEDVQKKFMLWLLWPIAALHISPVHGMDLFTAYAEQIVRSDAIDEMIGTYLRYLNDIAACYPGNQTVSREIGEVLQYIETYYVLDIALEEVADFVKMSPNYLGSQFKKEMQQHYGDYFVQYRIVKAMELLLVTRMKTSEVAGNVGFANQSYFSQAFKKMTGMSPLEFRRHWMADWPKDEDPDDQE